MTPPLTPSRFRVENYKSIRDSGLVWFAQDLTVLAGRNESGKSSLLEALRYFSPNAKEVPDDAWPIHLDNAVPTITVWCRVTTDQLNELLKEANAQLGLEVASKIVQDGLGLRYQPKSGYELDDPEDVLLAAIEGPEMLPQIDAMKAAVDACAKLLALTGWVEKWAELDGTDLESALTKWIVDANAKAATVPPATRAPCLEAIKQVQRLCNEIPEYAPIDRFCTAVKQALPPMVYFADSENLLPFEIPLAEAHKNPAVADFAKIAKLELSQLIGIKNGQVRGNLLRRHTAHVSGDFRGYYSQDKLDLVAEIDGEKLRIGVRAEGDTNVYRAEQRSQGFQWFLSFFLRLGAACSTGAMILIDEPGLFLHAKAQADILAMLEDLCKRFECRVVFSTHSPYMIDASRLDRVRLVEHSRAEGTTVENKIHRAATSDALTPIVTAIGLDVSKALAPVRSMNVLVEGISDYYFLQGFQSLYPDLQIRGAVVPAVGATKIPQLVSLLIGWGLKYVVVLDNDAEGNRCQKDLAQLDVAAEAIVRIPVKHGAIEGLFEPGELASIIAAGDERYSNTADKVLCAKKFFERCQVAEGSPKLAAATRERAKGLLESIRRAIDICEPAGSVADVVVKDRVALRSP